MKDQKSEKEKNTANENMNLQVTKPRSEMKESQIEHQNDARSEQQSKADGSNTERSGNNDTIGIP